MSANPYLATGAAAASPQGLTGGEALAALVQKLGTPCLFGMGGFQLAPYYEGIRRRGLRHVLVNDERSGVQAADALARVTGGVGVCDATLGPGATNLLTGLVECLNAGTPLLALIGGPHRGFSGRHMTQEARQADMLRPAVKEVLRVEGVARLPELFRRALAIANHGRPGPVVLEVPEDVAHGQHIFEDSAFDVPSRLTRHPALRCAPDPADLQAAAAILREARRPILLAGGGVHLSGAWQALASLAEQEAMPVAHTASGKGAIGCAHALSAGLFGRFARGANALIAEADAILVVGCKLGEVATRRYALLPGATPLLHLDILPEDFGRTGTEPTLPLWGDARLGLEALRDALGPADADRRRAARTPWLARLRGADRAWRALAAPRMASAASPIDVARVVAEIQAALPPDPILIADGGFAAHWLSLFLDVPGGARRFLADRGFAAIGYGLPAALGAALARPQARVIAVTGDGGLNMALGELETAVRARAAFTLVVLNNAASGYVKAGQHALYGPGAYQSSDLSEIDYAATARSLGAHGVRVAVPDELPAAFASALAANDRPTLIDVVVTRDPARMLPGADDRAPMTVTAGDRPA